MHRHSEVFYVAIAVGAIIGGIIVLAAALLLLQPGPFPRPFVARTATTTTHPPTTVTPGLNLGMHPSTSPQD